MNKVSGSLYLTRTTDVPLGSNVAQISLTGFLYVTNELEVTWVVILNKQLIMYKVSLT